jgi:MFS family permease
MSDSIFEEKGFVALLVVTYFGGFVMAINSAAAPYLAEDFALSSQQLAKMFGWFSVGSVGTLLLTRMVDSIGRRMLLIGSLAATLVLAEVTAFSPTLTFYILVQTIFSLFLGVVLVTAVVMMTEYLPSELRARGHGLAIIASVFGSGGSVLTITLFNELDVEYLWRWTWGISILVPIVFSRFILRSLTETTHFTNDQTLDREQETNWRELFEGEYRRRSIAIVTGHIFGVIPGVATMTYIFYYLVEILALGQVKATIIVMCGGAFAIVGGPLGARACDRLGRRNSIVMFYLLVMFSALGFYSFKTSGALFFIGLMIFFAGMITFDSALNVAERTITTELFPTRHRATFQGVLVVTGAIFSVVTHFSAAFLVDFVGSLTIAIVILNFFRIPGCIAYMYVPETKGMELHQSSLDH